MTHDGKRINKNEYINTIEQCKTSKELDAINRSPDNIEYRLVFNNGCEDIFWNPAYFTVEDGIIKICYWGYDYIYFQSNISHIKKIYLNFEDDEISDAYDSKYSELIKKEGR